MLATFTTHFSIDDVTLVVLLSCYHASQDTIEKDRYAQRDSMDRVDNMETQRWRDRPTYIIERKSDRPVDSRIYISRQEC